MTVSLRAYAKINLSLEVLGKRTDGYHEVATVLQTISLHDTVTVAPAAGLEASAPGLGCPDDENLAVRAAKLLRESAGCTRGARIRLRKRIPQAAGMGGGSSDAAATLLALNSLWGLGLSVQALAGLAAALGSDVPFFLRGGTSLATGRGEQLTELPGLSGYWVVLAVPPLAIPNKTRSLYAALSGADFSDGCATLLLAEGLRSGSGLEGSALPNAFERAAFAAYPVIDQHRQAMLAAGAPFVRLSGSGPALFTLVRSAAAGGSLRRRLAAGGMVCHLAHFQNAAGEPPDRAGAG